MPFLSHSHVHVPTAEAVEQLFDEAGSATGSPEQRREIQHIEVAGHAGRIIIGVLTVPPGKPLTGRDSQRQLIMAGLWDDSSRLAVAHMETRADGGNISRAHRRSVRIGAADYNPVTGTWREDYSAYNDSALWATSSLSDMTIGLNQLLSPASHDPLRDPEAHAYLRSVLEAADFPGHAFVEPMFTLAAQLAIAATPPVG